MSGEFLNKRPEGGEPNEGMGDSGYKTPDLSGGGIQDEHTDGFAAGSDSSHAELGLRGASIVDRDHPWRGDDPAADVEKFKRATLTTEMVRTDVEDAARVIGDEHRLLKDRERTGDIAPLYTNPNSPARYTRVDAERAARIAALNTLYDNAGALDQMSQEQGEGSAERTVTGGEVVGDLYEAAEAANGLLDETVLPPPDEGGTTAAEIRDARHMTNDGIRDAVEIVAAINAAEKDDTQLKDEPLPPEEQAPIDVETEATPHMADTGQVEPLVAPHERWLEPPRE